MKCRLKLHLDLHKERRDVDRIEEGEAETDTEAGIEAVAHLKGESKQNRQDEGQSKAISF